MLQLSVAVPPGATATVYFPAHENEARKSIFGLGKITGLQKCLSPVRVTRRQLYIFWEGAFIVGKCNF